MYEYIRQQSFRITQTHVNNLSFRIVAGTLAAAAAAACVCLYPAFVLKNASVWHAEVVIQ